MVDKMMATHLKNKETDFTENGGIRERMTAARLGRRKSQNEEIAELRAENERLKAENASLRRELAIAGSDGDSRNSSDSRDSRGGWIF
jgi:four helix bundle suffix protein